MENWNQKYIVEFILQPWMTMSFIICMGCFQIKLEFDFIAQMHVEVLNRPGYEQ